MSAELKELWTDRQLAFLLHMKVAALRRWRYLSFGPKFVKLGSAVRYRPEDVEEWLRSCPTGGGSTNE